MSASAKTPVQSATQSATVYVTSSGSNGNSGLTWASAKATIAAAVAALPAGAEGLTVGRIKAGPGSFPINSVGRFVVADVTSGSPTFLDSSAATGDIGKYVFSRSMTDVARVLSVVAGVSVTLDRNFSASATGERILVTTPGLILPAGVTIEGSGSTYANQTVVNSTNTLSSVTDLTDSGTGVSILRAHPVASATGMNTMNAGLEHLTVTGNTANAIGLMVQNDWLVRCLDIEFRYHGVAGVCLPLNVNQNSFRDCRFFRNGTQTATIVTGGVLMQVPNGAASAVTNFDNCWFEANWGWGVVSAVGFSSTPGGVGGILIDGCTFSLTRASAVANSGVDAYLGAGVSGRANVIGCWFENSTAEHLFVGNGPVTAVDCMFNGNGSQQQGVSVALSGGLFVAVGCEFGGHSGASIFPGTGTVAWVGCGTTDSIFVWNSGRTATLAAPTDAPGSGNIGAGVRTASLQVNGLTGATATSRYVGATASGAPVTGTFALGDFCIDQTAKLWICTTAGTPGTWTQA